MPAEEHPARISNAIVEHIAGGSVPSEGVAAASLSQPVLSSIATGLQNARAKVISEASKYSHEAGPSVDGWIKQAKKLQEDIETSRRVAQEIIRDAKDAGELDQDTQDASKTVNLLQGEVSFHGSLATVLSQIRSVSSALKTGQECVARSDLSGGLESLQLSRRHFESLRPARNTNAVKLLVQRAERLRSAAIEETKQQWDMHLKFDADSRSVRLAGDSDQASEPTVRSFETVIAAATQLDVLEINLVMTKNNFTTVLFRPLMSSQQSSRNLRVSVSELSLSLIEGQTHRGTSELIADLDTALSFIKTRLPKEIINEVAEDVVPAVIDELIEDRLSPAIPVSLDDIAQHDDLLQTVSAFTAGLTSGGWPGSDKLAAWVEDAPPVWLAKRRESYLGAIRSMLTKEIRNTKIVERVETQMVENDEGRPDATGDAEDWGAAWGEDDEQGTDEGVGRVNGSKKVDDDDDDGAAWDADQDPQACDPTRHIAKDNRVEDDDDGDAWGWDEPNSPAPAKSPAVRQSKEETVRSSKTESLPKPGQREMTLRETYTITPIPDGLKALIVQAVDDAAQLRTPDYEDYSIAPAAVGLYSMPTLILAGYRALSTTFYEELPGANMFIYNDTIRLTESLQEFAGHQQKVDESSSLPRSAWPTSRMKLDADIAAIQSFGRRAYGREMESQRTILRDLLDGAQGFANCTEPPFTDLCEGAVKATSDRMRQVAKEWSEVLSRSALLQSLGSLLSTILNKFILDIGDMSDISADESTKLREFSDQITKLGDLFTQEVSKGEMKEIAHVYTPEWFKFAYLGEIMDSSLADITALWEDGILQADFDAVEVCDLVEALFADSPHRREAIKKIRA